MNEVFTSLPTEDGLYWLRVRDSFGRPDEPTIVRVSMAYTFRRKVRPFVIAPFWSGPLAEFGSGAEWSGPLRHPFKDPA